MRSGKLNIQWEHSYVAGDKTFCIDLADDEGLIHEHAKRSGVPASKITEVRTMIDPVTAGSHSSLRGETGVVEQRRW